MANQLTRQRALIAEGFQPIVRRCRVSATPTGALQNTGLTLPARAVVLGVFVDVRVAEATGTTKTIDVGRDSDPNGYLAAVSVASVGVKKGTLDSAGQTLGALLTADEDGAGALVPEPDVAGGGETVNFTAGSNDWAEFRGDIYVVYLNLSNK